MTEMGLNPAYSVAIGHFFHRAHHNFGSARRTDLDQNMPLPLSRNLSFDIRRVDTTCLSKERQCAKARTTILPFRQRLGLVPLHNPVRVSVMTALGSLLPLAISVGLAYLVVQFIPADASLEKFFEQLTLAWGVVLVVTIALAPGFIEEMLFRGYVQRRLLERWSPAWAIGVASLLFTLAHVTLTPWQ